MYLNEWSVYTRDPYIRRIELVLMHSELRRLTSGRIDCSWV
jgi:hypothetical protein